jgi:hypothetical protein
VIASDLETDAVVYDATDTDHVIITDVSGSMGWDGNIRLSAAIDAANLFMTLIKQQRRVGAGLLDHDVVDTLAIEFATLHAPHRRPCPGEQLRSPGRHQHRRWLE